MLNIDKIWFGFYDAINYIKRENKEFFNRIFYKDNNLDKILSPHNYFLVGEKGTGKTAYSIYLSNSDYNGTCSYYKVIGEVEYTKFVQMKKKHLLGLSDYTIVWKVILLVLLSQHVYEKERRGKVFPEFGRLNLLKEAIDEFYKKRFTPEILQAVELVDKAEYAAKIFAEWISLSGKTDKSEKLSSSNVQEALSLLLDTFESVLGNLKLSNNYVLFLDGLDIRPVGMKFQDYIECIKGLAQATWQLNSGFLANIKDSKGRMKIVLLSRADIFNRFGLQNQNAKLKDNSTILDWTTTYNAYRESGLFCLIDQILSKQQKALYSIGECWDHYFPYKCVNEPIRMVHQQA